MSSTVNLAGSFSGLDTTSIINALLQVDANQQTLVSNKQTAEQKTVDAYTSLTSALSAVATQARTVATTSAWAGSTATSSSSNVTASVTGTQTASFTFDVTSLAATHTLVSSGAVSSLATVVSDNPITITGLSGSTTSIDVGTGSLSEVVNAINSSDSGVTAAAVQTTPGSYKLQLSATKSGAAAQFSVDGITGMGDLTVLSQGADATISVGTDPNTAYTVTSSSNTFNNLVTGLSFTVSKIESGVTVSSKVDGTAVAKQVSTLVDDINQVLSTITSQTSWDATNKVAGPLMAESAVRTLQQQLLGSVTSLHAAGVSLTKDGQLSFDQDAFTTAFTANPQKVMAAFGATATLAPASGVTGGVSLVRAADYAHPGTYAVHLDQTAATEQWAADLSGVSGSGHQITVTQGTLSATYTTTDDDTTDSIAANLNNLLSSQGVAVTAANSDAGFLLTANGAGSALAFDVSVDGSAQSQLQGGQDVQGTIDGHTATGYGDVLSLASGNGNASGLALRITATADDVANSGGDIGDVTFTEGFAQKLLTVTHDATAIGTGYLTTASAGHTSDIQDLQKQYDAWTQRLQDERTSLQTRFTAMETALSTLQSQNSFVSGLSTNMLGTSG